MSMWRRGANLLFQVASSIGMMCHWGLESYGPFCSWSFSACGVYPVCRLSLCAVLSLCVRLLLVESSCWRRLSVCELFLLAEFSLWVSPPVRGNFLLTEVFWFMNFPCSRNFSCLWAILLVEFTCSGFLLRIFHRLCCASDSGSLHFLWPIVSSRIFLHRYLQPLTSFLYGVRHMIA